jgi:TonB-dependent receptor
LEELAQYHMTAGGVHRWGNTELDYTVAFSKADERHEPQYQTEWELDKKANMALDLSKPEAPKWTITNLDETYQFDPTRYKLASVDFRNTYASNWHYTGSVNFKMPYALAGYPAQLKLGAKLRYEGKDRDEDRWQYKWTGTTSVLLSDMGAAPVNKSFFNGEYSRFAPELSEEKFETFFCQNKDMTLKGTLRYWDSEGQWFVAKETVPAYYLMTTVNLGKAQVLAGFRHEFTRNDYEGTKLFFDQAGNYQSMERVKVKRTYNNLLPMVHMKYQFGPWTQLRLAYTHAMARPNFWDLAPYFFVNPKNESVVQGNPDLKPTVARNADVMFEHYFRGIGTASAGLFYKNLKDIIFTKTSKIVGGKYDDYWLEKPVNGGSANLYGFELNWHQELSFLPGFLSGFGIYANYTHTWSDADLLGRKGVVPGQAGDVGNFALAYEKYNLSARLSFNYHAKFITEVGEDEDYDEWQDERLQVDFSAAYDIARWMQAYFEAINITNAPSWTYLGVHDRPLVVAYYSWWIKAGLKFNFRG